VLLYAVDLLELDGQDWRPLPLEERKARLRTRRCDSPSRLNRFPDAEADLLVIIDGQAMLCEVKSSWHAVRPAHLADFVALARQVRPDTALLAVMEAGPGPAADLAAARAQLAGERIEFELLTADAYMPADDPYLDFDDDG
jgi:hypothetical protein